jgi:hypothetical protein
VDLEGAHGALLAPMLLRSGPYGPGPGGTASGNWRWVGLRDGAVVVVVVAGRVPAVRDGAQRLRPGPEAPPFSRELWKGRSVRSQGVAQQQQEEEETERAKAPAATRAKNWRHLPVGGGRLRRAALRDGALQAPFARGSHLLQVEDPDQVLEALHRGIGRRRRPPTCSCRFGPPRSPRSTASS